MSFCTAVNCMDGRVQLPVIRYLQGRFNAEHVDVITEPGPNLILAKRTDEDLVQSILRRINISVEKHSSVAIALAGHHECAGNPATQEGQKRHLVAGIEFLCLHYRNVPIIGLWVDENWKVHEIVHSEIG
ncbi:MAG: carbonic anhydrase [bacterium]